MTPLELATWSLRISVAALVISALSFWNAWRVGRLQARKLKRELADDEAARQRAREADIRVELKRNPDRIVLHNAGGAPALDVTLAFVSSSNPVIASEAPQAAGRANGSRRHRSVGCGCLHGPRGPPTTSSSGGRAATAGPGSASRGRTEGNNAAGPCGLPRAHATVSSARRFGKPSEKVRMIVARHAGPGC